MNKNRKQNCKNRKNVKKKKRNNILGNFQKFLVKYADNFYIIST